MWTVTTNNVWTRFLVLWQFGNALSQAKAQALRPGATGVRRPRSQDVARSARGVHTDADRKMPVGTWRAEKCQQKWGTLMSTNYH